MKQFPKILATPQDVENIKTNHPEYHKQLKSYLLRAYDEPDEATQVTDYDTDPDTGEMINVVTIKIMKVKMKYKDLGFKDKDKLKEFIEEL